MQRLLLVLTEFPPRIGGMQTHAAYLSRHLAQQGYRIEVFTHRSSDPALAEEAEAYDREQPFPIHRILGRLSYEHNLQMLARHAERFAPDLIYSSTVYYGTLRERSGIPVVCRCVGNDVMRPWLGYPYRFGSRMLNSASLEKLAHRWLEKHYYPDWVETLFRNKREQLTRQAASAASHIFANSEFTSRLLRDVGIPAERLQTVPGGVDSARFHAPDAGKREARRELGLPASGLLLMTACRLVAKKGIDLLLDAMPRLQKTLPYVHLVVVGDGKYRERFQQYCIERGISGVIFAGRVPHERIHRYFSACDLFVLASRDSVNAATGTRDVETMGRVLCEANAAGIPVIASRCGGIPSVIADGVNGLLFEPEHIEQMMERIHRLQSDANLRRDLVDEGLRRAREEFDWSTILRIHSQAFGRLAARAYGIDNPSLSDAVIEPQTL